jgi:hypothetical protein
VVVHVNVFGPTTRSLGGRPELDAPSEAEDGPLEDQQTRSRNSEAQCSDRAASAVGLRVLRVDAPGSCLSSFAYFRSVGEPNRCFGEGETEPLDCMEGDLEDPRGVEGFEEGSLCDLSEFCQSC